MAKVLLTEEEYLTAGFEDRVPEYLDGEVVERTLPNNHHSQAQGELVFRFRLLEEKHRLFARPELRVRVAERRYRIADLVVYSDQKPLGLLPTQLPLVIAEVVSPDDKHEDLMKRLEEYRAWGVPHVWLVDPGLRRLYVYNQSGLASVPAFELPELHVRIPIEEILR
jgi:Uma2 family endonuclease